MSSNLASYQSLYGSLTSEITTNLTRIVQNLKRSSTSSEDFIDTKTLIQRTDKNFEDATELFEQMELEIRELPTPEEKSRHTTQLDSFKAELKRLKQEYILTQKRVRRHEERAQLFDGADDEVNGGGDFVLDDMDSRIVTNAKERLIENTEKLERASRRLDQGQGILEETESIGAGVLNDLSHQREVLMRSRNRLRDTDDDLGTSSRVLSVMVMRAQRSRVVLAIVVVAIIAAIILGVYFSFKG